MQNGLIWRNERRRFKLLDRILRLAHAVECLSKKHVRLNCIRIDRKHALILRQSAVILVAPQATLGQDIVQVEIGGIALECNLQY